jgi:hypothetical protein
MDSLQDLVAFKAHRRGKGAGRGGSDAGKRTPIPESQWPTPPKNFYDVHAEAMKLGEAGYDKGYRFPREDPAILPMLNKVEPGRGYHESYMGILRSWENGWNSRFMKSPEYPGWLKQKNPDAWQRLFGTPKDDLAGKSIFAEKRRTLGARDKKPRKRKGSKVPSAEDIRIINEDDEGERRFNQGVNRTLREFIRRQASHRK